MSLLRALTASRTAVSAVREALPQCGGHGPFMFPPYYNRDVRKLYGLKNRIEPVPTVAFNYKHELNFLETTSSFTQSLSNETARSSKWYYFHFGVICAVFYGMFKISASVPTPINQTPEQSPLVRELVYPEQNFVKLELKKPYARPSDKAITDAYVAAHKEDILYKKTTFTVPKLAEDSE
eukprot:TRINITY_DN21121_c0_g1::TRINITY_DN21121_c0_g1_i1::g.23373::m.23373 TRINITY_DN21121_c0_g1::TRINITY_DN21121_c0_g1_i1::g.23373  ORF type:complete len:193 (+),score=35.70 TRINITY_DN21121_c0_g1_i1:41-580(+)